MTHATPPLRTTPQRSREKERDRNNVRVQPLVLASRLARSVRRVGSRGCVCGARTSDLRLVPLAARCAEMGFWIVWFMARARMRALRLDALEGLGLGLRGVRAMGVVSAAALPAPLSCTPL